MCDLPLLVLIVALCGITEASDSSDGNGPGTALGTGERPVSLCRWRALQSVSVPERLWAVTRLCPSEYLQLILCMHKMNPICVICTKFHRYSFAPYMQAIMSMPLTSVQFVIMNFLKRFCGILHATAFMHKHSCVHYFSTDPAAVILLRCCVWQMKRVVFFQDWLHGFPGLTDTSEHICFYFFFFSTF